MKRDGLRYSVNELERVLKGGDFANREREVKADRRSGPLLSNGFKRRKPASAGLHRRLKSYKLQSENFPPKYKFEPTQRWAGLTSRWGNGPWDGAIASARILFYKSSKRPPHPVLSPKGREDAAAADALPLGRGLG